MEFHFPIILIDKDFFLENLSESCIRILVRSIESKGMDVLGFRDYDDFQILPQQISRAACFILSVNDKEFEFDILKIESAFSKLRSFIFSIRIYNEHVPIFLYGKTFTAKNIPNDIRKKLHGFLYMYEDTSEFIARHIIRTAKIYLKSLSPPFFQALTRYTLGGSYSWHCPGHSGGIAFLKSPIGRMFHQFFGENMLRADVCNAVDDLGQLLDHTGPIASSERNAARIFNCDYLFFVTNGTSTSNKIVWHSTMAPGDIAIVDRNCHKSVLHAIIMTGAIPVFLMPKRNQYSIIGPIDKKEFKWENIEKKIAQHPFIKDKNIKPRILTITQSTYDGILYNVEMIKEMLDGKIETLHFDEAWLPHANFHKFYKDMHAIGEKSKKLKNSIIFSTQSTHKLLAGLSQASQILVQDSINHHFDRNCFNEAYLMHTSTSPQYSIIASCDVAAAMMEGSSGVELVNESICEALDFRRTMRKISKEENTDWWFKVWEPDRLFDEEGVGQREDWLLKPGESWHNFGLLEDNFNMLDPIKVTIITPGININGNFLKTGIPANIVTKYLAEHGIIVEKTGLYSFFIMFTIGITKGRWNTLVTILQQFKIDFDRNECVGKVLPKFVNKHPEYEHCGLKDLSQKIHQIYKQYNIACMMIEMYISDMIPAMLPTEVWSRMAHRDIERVKIDHLEGRITAVLLTPYPPGIPLLIPGERFNRIIINYLRFIRKFNEVFPGFETDMHGLIKETKKSYQEYYVDCIRK